MAPSPYPSPQGERGRGEERLTSADVEQLKRHLCYDNLSLNTKTFWKIRTLVKLGEFLKEFLEQGCRFGGILFSCY
jgi:hypothetical protein